MIILPDDDHDPLLSVSPSVEITRSFTTQPETRIRDSPALFSLLFFTNPFLLLLFFLFFLSLFLSFFS